MACCTACSASPRPVRWRGFLSLGSSSISEHGTPSLHPSLRGTEVVDRGIKKCEQIARDFIHTIHISECIFKCLCANGDADNLDQNLGLRPGPGFFSEAKLPTAAAFLVGRGASHRRRHRGSTDDRCSPARCCPPRVRARCTRQLCHTSLH